MPQSGVNSKQHLTQTTCFCSLNKAITTAFMEKRQHVRIDKSKNKQGRMTGSHVTFALHKTSVKANTVMRQNIIEKQLLNIDPSDRAIDRSPTLDLTTESPARYHLS